MKNVNGVKWDSNLLFFALMWKFFIDSFREMSKEKCDTKIGHKPLIFSFFGESTLLELSWNDLESMRLVWD